MTEEWKIHFGYYISSYGSFIDYHDNTDYNSYLFSSDESQLYCAANPTEYNMTVLLWGVVAQWQRARLTSERSQVRSLAGLNYASTLCS